MTDSKLPIGNSGIQDVVHKEASDSRLVNGFSELPLTKLLMRHEGFSSKPYYDSVGKVTIGYGRNLDDLGLSQEECVFLLRNDILRTFSELCSFPWFTTLNEARQDALINMCFNLGFQRFSQFKKTIAAIEIGDFKAAAHEMLQSKWYEQVGHRAVELAEMLAGGKYSDS